MVELQMVPGSDAEAEEARGLSQGEMLVELAGSAGCGLEPVAFSVLLRGRCPFHYGAREGVVGVMEVDRDQGRFHCRGCGVRGGVYAFAARLWGMAVSEARQRLTGGGETYLEAERPAGLVYGVAPRRDEAPRPQNTAVLTRAWWHFASGLSDPAAVRYLTKLDLTIDEAQKGGVGYCSGSGLRRFLLERGISEAEVGECPLFRGAEHEERMGGSMTVGELDYAQGVSSFIQVSLATPDRGTEWPADAPSWRAIPGQRPFLVGRMLLSTRPAEVLLVTDDARVFVVARSVGATPVVLVRADPQPKRVSNHLLRVRPRRVALALGSREFGEALASELSGQLECSVLPQDWIGDCLDGNRRWSRRVEGEPRLFG